MKILILFRPPPPPPVIKAEKKSRTDPVGLHQRSLVIEITHGGTARTRLDACMVSMDTNGPLVETPMRGP